MQQVQQAWSTFIHSKPLRSKHILLVDDKDLHCHLEKKLLNKERAEVTHFRDGIELVQHVEQIKQSHKGPEDTISWLWHAGFWERVRACSLSVNHHLNHSEVPFMPVTVVD